LGCKRDKVGTNRFNAVAMTFEGCLADNSRLGEYGEMSHPIMGVISSMADQAAEPYKGLPFTE
jgi:hypothetical protein